MNYLDQFTTLFINPKKYYDYIKKTKPAMSDSFLFYLTFAAIAALFTFIGEGVYLAISQLDLATYLGVDTLDMPEISTTALLIAAFAVSLTIMLLSPFISAAMIHIGILLITAKKGFKTTFTAVARSMPISSAYGFAISIISIVIALVLTQQHSIIMGLLGFIASLISIIHLIYTQTIGLQKLHGITFGKALISILLVPALLLVTLFVIGIILVIVMLAGFGILA